MANQKLSSTTIQDLNLTKAEVWQVVKEWYTNGMFPDILQNEDGYDLEEICEAFIEDQSQMNEVPAIEESNT